MDPVSNQESNHLYSDSTSDRQLCFEGIEIEKRDFCLNEIKKDYIQKYALNETYLVENGTCVTATVAGRRATDSDRKSKRLISNQARLLTGC